MTTAARPVCVIGTSRVGIGCMLGLAELDWYVHGYDPSSERVERLRRGTAQHRDPEVADMLRRHIDDGRIVFYDRLELATRDIEVALVAVDVPLQGDDSVDLSALWAAVERLATIEFSAFPTIVVLSAIPPGTADALAAYVKPWAELVYAPQFARDGSAVRDFLCPDSIVVGCDSPCAGVPYLHLLERLQAPVVFTSRCNAELIKGCSSAYSALKTSFAHEVSNLCEAFGATPDDVLRAVGYDRGASCLRPGTMFGGTSQESDVKSLEYVAGKRGAAAALFSASLRVNDAQPGRIVDMLAGELGGSLANATVGIWGFTSKAESYDVADSFASRVVRGLARCGARMLVYEPHVRAAALPEGSSLVTSALEAASADALLVLTEGPEFARIDPLRYADLVSKRIVVDAPNVLDPARVAAAGLRYRGFGRSISPAPSAGNRRDPLRDEAANPC